MNNALHKIKTFIGLITTWPIFFLSLLTPRSKKVWVFIGWHKSPEGEIFADNTKYFFLHLHQNVPGIQAIWLAKDRGLAQTLNSKGYASYYEKSLAGIYYALRARYTVIDAYLQKENFRWSGRTRIIQLLHGKGMKKKGYSEKPMRKNDYIFNTSDFTLSILPEAFKVGSKNFITGYPRNDVLFKEIAEAEISVSTDIKNKLKEIRETKKDALCVWYTPTFRRGQKVLDIEGILNPKFISEWAQKNNVFFFVSLHPKYREQAKNYSYPNIIFFDESDVYPLIKSFDVLIADYSSIFSDFLLTLKPLVFYAYDLAEYSKKEGLSADYNAITPGPKVNTPQELAAALEKIKSGEDAYAEERKRVMFLYHKYQDGKSSERIFEILKSEEKLPL